MRQALCVAAGGALGAVLRFRLVDALLALSSRWNFPLGTLLVNVSGCFAAGLLAGLVEKRGWLTTDARLFLFMGLLGGYTTFSAFGLETVSLLQRQQAGAALLNVAASVGAGLLALWLGLKLA